MRETDEAPPPNALREKIWQVIFRHDTPASKAFDIFLLFLISISVLVIMLESVDSFATRHGESLKVLEWIFTVIFTLEYLVRIWTVRNKRKYLFSFFGIVDLLSILPTYLLLIPGLADGPQYLVTIRILRLLRMFRILKMIRHMGEANILVNALIASRSKITVFIFCVVAVTAILGSMMYLVENVIYGNTQFSSIPESIYWAVVTISTVGYGDVTPISPLGKLLSSCIMLLGYGIIAVPTGIVNSELNLQVAKIRMDSRVCKSCDSKGHDPKASHCKMCGTPL